MKNYIVVIGTNPTTGKIKAKGFDSITEAVEFADKVKETTGNYPTIRKAVYTTVTAEEINVASKISKGE